MKKFFYLFVMVAGMSLASVNVNAQDPKAPVKKEATAACCKSGETASAAKCDKMATAACANKDAKATSQNVNDKAAGACCKSKAVATTSEAKGSKSVN